MERLSESLLAILNSKNYELGTMPMLIALIAGTLAAILVYFIYEVLYDRKNQGSSINRSFILIGPATTTLFLAIQFSLPLSLGLLGALSFIRFRTPVKDPEEIAYVLVVVATSICAATFNFMIGTSLLVVVAICIAVRQKIFGRLNLKKNQWRLIVVGGNLDTVVSELSMLEKKFKLVGLTRKGTSDIAYFQFGNVAEEEITRIASDLKVRLNVESVDVMLQSQL